MIRRGSTRRGAIDILHVVFLFGIVALLPAWLPGATITVGLDEGVDYTDIQTAIDAAVDGDTVLVKPGDYLILRPIAFRGKPITVKAEAGPEETTIRMGETPLSKDMACVVFLGPEDGPDCLLDGFTLTGGKGYMGNDSGGGIFCKGARGKVKGCRIKENVNPTYESMSGGGIFCEGGSPSFIDCLVQLNSAGSRGTGGGVCLTKATAVFTDCTILANHSGGGGGIFSLDGDASELRGCLIQGNRSGGDGGGILCSTQSSLKVISCKIAGNNDSNFGGGIKCEYSAPAFINCLIVGNATGDGTYGGALCCWEGGFPLLTNCTIYGNGTLDRGEGGLSCFLGGSPTLVNCLISSNSPPSLCGALIKSPTVASSGFVRPGRFTFSRFINIGFSEMLPDFVIDLGDYHLRADSPAIDAGNRQDAPETDFEGSPRPCGSQVDIGAYEYCPTLAQDCNQNRVEDSTDIATGASQDCNRNGVPDECDVLSAGTSFEVGQVITRFATRAIAAADLDRNGSADLALVTELGMIETYKNDGEGEISFFWDSPIFEFATVSPGDLDGDGDLDLVSMNKARAEVDVVFNKGSGVFNGIFEFPDTYPIGGIARSGVVSDLNGDALPDIVTANTDLPDGGQGRSISVLLDTGGGKMGRATEYVTGAFPSTVTTGAFASDGSPDIAVAWTGEGGAGTPAIGIFTNQGSGSFERGVEIPLSGAPRALVRGDLDGDGRDDLAASTAASEGISVFLGNGDGTFRSGASITPGAPTVTMAAGDIDQDGNLDLVYSAEGKLALSVLLNRGHATFRGVQSLAMTVTAVSIIVSDLDRDGKPDLVLVPPTPMKNLVVLKNQTLAPSSRDGDSDGIPDECQPTLFHRGDANGDGDVDISDGLCILNVLFLSGGCPGSAGGGSVGDCLEAADMNNDGALDCTDPIFILGWLFLGTMPPPLPGPPPAPCGPDSDQLGSPGDLGCETYSRCG